MKGGLGRWEAGTGVAWRAGEGPHARVARATDSAAFADSSLPPPLQVILEYEGVVVPDVSALHDAAWATVAAAEGRPPPRAGRCAAPTA